MDGWLQSTGFLHYILCYVDVNFWLLIFGLVYILNLGICIFLICWGSGILPIRLVGNSSVGNLSWPLYNMITNKQTRVKS
jgi:hypothetical protein